MTEPLTLPVPLVDLWGLHEPIADELREAFERVLRSSAFSSGPEVAAFEADLAAACQTSGALGVGSGTSALQIALMAAGIGAGDEVIIPANTFFATFEAVALCGATPVLADVEPHSANIDVDSASAAITERTAAIIAVHLYGQPADMDRVGELASKHGLFVLEDAAQAIGAAWNGKPAGSLGDAAAFSFYAGKNLGALGEAGGITSNDSALLERCDLLRQHGQPRRYEHDVVGMNERMDGLQGAFLAIKLKHLPAWQKDRDKQFERFARQLKEIDGVSLLGDDERATHVHHLLPVFVDHRDEVLAGLHERQVGAGIHYPFPLHLVPPGSGCGAPGSFPVAERLASTTLSLPLFPGITDAQVDYCVEALDASIRGLS